MGRQHYDGQGRLVGRSESDSERLAKDAASAAGLALLAIMAAIIAPFIPILWLGYQAFQILTASVGWHELFAGFVALVLIAGSLWLLWSFKWVRIPYFGAEVLFAAWFTFHAITEKNDAIWGGFIALIVLAVGTGVMAMIERQFKKHFT